MMDLRAMYDGIVELQQGLQAELLADAPLQLQYEEHLRSAPDYRLIHALSAAFTLQEYLANRLAEDPQQP